jgi:hypothetical protein
MKCSYKIKVYMDYMGKSELYCERYYLFNKLNFEEFNPYEDFLDFIKFEFPKQQIKIEYKYPTKEERYIVQYDFLLPHDNKMIWTNHWKPASMYLTLEDANKMKIGLEEKAKRKEDPYVIYKYKFRIKEYKRYLPQKCPRYLVDKIGKDKVGIDLLGNTYKDGKWINIK